MRGWLAMLAIAGCGASAPAPEAATAATANVAVELPPIPTFTRQTFAAGITGANDLRHAGREGFGFNYAVDGYVVWAYSCAELETDPTSCLRPHFYLGASASTPKERAIRVVEVPRHPTTIETKRLPEAELAEWPTVPTYAVGDRVIVRGEWLDKAPHGDTDSEGLLIYAALDHVAADAPPPAVTVEDKPHALAERLVRHIQNAPTAEKAYLILAAMYREWGFLDESLAVYEAGIAHVDIPAHRRSLVFAKAWLHDERGELDLALSAVDRVLDEEPGFVEARVQRGRWRQQKGDFAGAKLDLEAAVEDATDEFSKRAAQRALMELAVEGH